jgi:ATP synthase protein I
MPEAMRYAVLGVQLAATMVFSILAGVFLDRWLDTTPWLTLAGALFGIASFFAQIFRLSHDLQSARKPGKRP